MLVKSGSKSVKLSAAVIATARLTDSIEWTALFLPNGLESAMVQVQDPALASQQFTSTRENVGAVL